MTFLNLVQFDDFDGLLARISVDFDLPIDKITNTGITDFAEKIYLNSWSDLQNLEQREDLFETLEIESELESQNNQNFELEKLAISEKNPEKNNLTNNILVQLENEQKDQKRLELKTKIILETKTLASVNNLPPKAFWQQFKQKNQIYLANFENLATTKESVEFVADFNEKNSQNRDSSQKIQIYLYSSKEINLADKALWKKFKIPLEILKIDQNQKSTLAQKWSQKLNLKLTAAELSKITLQASSFQEIINKLDFLEATGQPSKYLEQVYLEEIPLLFVLDLSVKSLLKWKNLVVDDNLQMALSLIFGKLEKKDPILAKLVIQTDQKIKTRGKIKPLLWWKMLLWQLSKI